MQVTANKNIVSSFVNAWILYAVSKSILHIKASTFNILPKLGYLEIEGFHNIDNIQDNVTYDFIFGDFPIGLKRGELNYDSKSINVRENWLAILKSLKSLNKNGSALFLLEATGFGNVEGRIFEKALNESGYFVNAYFNLPEKILFPQTGCRVLLGYISRNKTEKTFVAELIDETQAQDVAKSCLQHINQNSLTNGKYIDSGCFTGFNQLIIREKIAQLETQYKNYKEFSLGEISTRISYVKSGEQLQECNNAIYIPKIGNSKVICNLEDAKLKHHNYFQVVLGDLALNEYVMSFFRSTLGKLVLDSLVSGTFIPHLNKKDIEQALVALPTIDEQKNICNTQKKLHHLKNAMDEFDAELALNPSGSISILNQLDMMSHAIGQLTDVDTIHRLLREGESKYVEFKETLSLDVKKQTKEKYIEDSALKTVVAFLNTDGGKLVIGVTDNCEISGMDLEIQKFYKSLDKFLLHWKNLLKVRIGEQYYPFIEYRIVNINNMNILLIECTPSQSGCYLDGNDFYVRTNPATDKLEGPKLVEYVKNHFK